MEIFRIGTNEIARSGTKMIPRKLATVAMAAGVVIAPTTACETEPYDCGHAVLIEKGQSFSDVLDSQFTRIPGIQEPDTSREISVTLGNPRVSFGKYFQACGTAEEISIAIGPTLDEDGNVEGTTTFNNVKISPYTKRD